MTIIKNYSLFLLLCSLFFFSECKTKKIVTGPATVRRTDTLAVTNEAFAYIKKSRENIIDYDWFSTRIRVEYSDNEISQDFSAVVRMRRDSALWISLQGPFGIEGGRVLVTRDSIFVVNKLSNEYLRQPISYLSRVLPIQTNLSELQDFILGSYLLFTHAVPGYKGMEDSLHIIRAESPEFLYQSGLFPLNCTLAKCVLTDKMQGQQMKLTFDGYSAEQGKPFSHERNVGINKGDKKLSLHLVFTKIKINEVQNFPFEISPGMSKVDRIRF
jgi:hypothetical protein